MLDKGDADGAIAAGRGLAARLRDMSHSYVRGYVLGVLAGALTMRGDLHEALTAARDAALPDPAIDRLGRMGAGPSEDQAMTLALKA